MKNSIKIDILSKDTLDDIEIFNKIHDQILEGLAVPSLCRTPSKRDLKLLKMSSKTII